MGNNASSKVLTNNFLKPTAVSHPIPTPSYPCSDPLINISPRRPEPEAILWLRNWTGCNTQTGAPCSPQRTWAEHDGRSPISANLSRMFSSDPNKIVILRGCDFVDLSREVIEF